MLNYQRVSDIKSGDVFGASETLQIAKAPLGDCIKMSMLGGLGGCAACLGLQMEQSGEFWHPKKWYKIQQNVARIAKRCLLKVKTIQTVLFLKR